MNFALFYFHLKIKPYSNLMPFLIQWIIILFITDCFTTNPRTTHINLSFQVLNEFPNSMSVWIKCCFKQLVCLFSKRTRHSDSIASNSNKKNTFGFLLLVFSVSPPFAWENPPWELRYFKYSVEKLFPPKNKFQYHIY